MSIEINSTITEELMMHAQRIVTFFGNNMQKDMCLIQIPIAAYMEAEQYLDRADVFNEADKIYGKDVDQLEKDITNFNESPLVSAIRSNSRNKCFDCNLPVPSFDFSSFKSDLVDDIKSFLSGGNKLFSGGVNASLPNLAYLLSFLCLPDLTKMLSLLLMRLLGTLGKFNLGNFNLTGFIMAIIGKILKAMLSFLNTMFKYSLGSSTCIIETLKTLSSLVSSTGNELESAADNFSRNLQILTEDSARIQSKIFQESDNYQKKIDKVNESLGKFSSKSAEENKKFQEAMVSLAQKLPEKSVLNNVAFEKEFKELENTFQSSITHLMEQVQNLLGLKTYFECEAKRNGTSVASEIEGIQNVIMLINLIKSIIQRKSNKLANTSYNATNKPNVAPLLQEDQFDIGDIATVISDVLGKEVAIASTDSTDIGILIGNSNNKLNNSLDLFSCNLIDFIDNSDFNSVISDAANIITSGTGIDPVIPRVTLDDIYNSVNSNYIFAPINPVQLDNIGTQIKTIMDYLGAVSVPTTTVSNKTGTKISGNISTVGSINVEEIDADSITARLFQLS